MKLRDRKLALKAALLRAKGLDSVMVGQKLKVGQGEAQVILWRGELIAQAEAHRLTERELLVMAGLARLEARRTELGGPLPTIGELDRALDKRPGFSSAVIKKRLRTLRDGEPLGVGELNRIGFIRFPRDAGGVWLTPAGWAFVWATGLITKNWKVPA